MFRLSVIGECSYCLEQSYLFDMVAMVIPLVLMTKDTERICSYVYIIYIYMHRFVLGVEECTVYV